jgi:haloacetate dehalogenase
MRRCMFEGFESNTIGTERARIFVRRRGSGPPLLLLHGFPETHLMWRDVSPVLADDFTVVCADLPGYGASGCPPPAADHAPHSKRSMATTMLELMDALGFDRFCVAGHDRGGRVAYRMALDEAGRVERVAVLDVLPVDITWEMADARLALGFWPWSLLAQPEPLPERLVSADPEAVIDDALGGAWGSPANAFDEEVREAYVAALRDPEHVHSICEEYRAAATIDREDDAGDRAAGRRIASPMLVLWSADGPLATWYRGAGGPLTLWRELADDVRGQAVDGGHFFPEEHPAETAKALAAFFRGGAEDGLSPTVSPRAP